MLAQQLAQLTERVAQLEGQLRPERKQRWREAFDTLPDDEISREAFRLGEEWRKSEGISE